MKANFLVGNFLTAFSGAYRYSDRTRRMRGLETDQLAVRFEERARAHRSRNHGYAVRLQAGLVAALLVTVGVARIDFRPGSAFQVSEVPTDVIAMEDVVQTVQHVLPPPPPRPQVPVVVSDDTILDDEDLDLDATLVIDEPLAALPPPPPPSEQQAIEEDDEDEIFIVVESPPEIIGGWASLARSLEYPELAQRAGIEGTVVVEVVIDEKGVPTDPSVRKSVTEVLDDAAVQAVLQQRFTPGEQRGRPVRVRMNIPVIFRLRA